MSEHSASDSKHHVALSDDDLAFIKSVLDEKVSCSDVSKQDKAVELLEQLPEVSNRSWRRWS